MNRMFFRRGDGQPPAVRERMCIGVIGAGPGTGASFVAGLIAFMSTYLGNATTFLQITEPRKEGARLYNSVGMDERFQHRSFNRVYHMVSCGESLKKVNNLEQNINWMIVSPEDVEENRKLSLLEKNRLMNSATGGIVVVDFDSEEQLEKFLPDLDRLFVVANPLPSKLLRDKKACNSFRRLREAGSDIRFVVNGYNSGVSRREVKRFFQGDSLIWIEKYPFELLCNCEYTCRFCWEKIEKTEEFQSFFTKVSQ